MAERGAGLAVLALALTGHHAAFTRAHALYSERQWQGWIAGFAVDG